MIAKLIGQSLQLPVEQVIPLEDGRTITNPTDETLIELLGYKRVIEEDEPPAQDGFYYDYEYQEDDEHIYKVWIPHEIPQVTDEPDEEPFMSEDEIFTAILFGKDV